MTMTKPVITVSCVSLPENAKRTFPLTTGANFVSSRKLPIYDDTHVSLLDLFTSRGLVRRVVRVCRSMSTHDYVRFIVFFFEI